VLHNLKKYLFVKRNALQGQEYLGAGAHLEGEILAFNGQMPQISHIMTLF
jgi:hypothetical protein